MKLKYALFPYVLLVLIIPALTNHLAGPLHLNIAHWELAIDVLMAAVGLLGLIKSIFKPKKTFRSWIPLLLLIALVMVPQFYLWKTQSKGSYELRQIYRFGLFCVTLFIIPLEVHFNRKEICILIGLIIGYGLFCCAYEIWQHPRVWEGMLFFSGKTSTVTSFFEQRNRFGAYTALWMILSLFAVQLSHRRFWLIPAVIFGSFLIMSESRGALLLAGLYLVFTFFSYRKRLGTKNFLMILADILIVISLILLIPPLHDFVIAIIDTDRGVTGRDKIWQVSWDYFLEGNPLLGHGLGVSIEKIMTERLRTNVSTHNVYLYILNSGGIFLMLFYILSFAFLLRRHCYRHHYLIPLLLAVSGYGIFELACAPFDNWHLSTMFTICLFFIPATAGLQNGHHHLPIVGVNAVQQSKNEENVLDI